MIKKTWYKKKNLDFEAGKGIGPGILEFMGKEYEVQEICPFYSDCDSEVRRVKKWKKK